MNRQIILRIAVLALAGTALTGCETLREAAGSGKMPPDEFAVVTKAPLVIPPDYNLRPPQPGAAPTNQISPTQSAQAALFPSDPQAAAATITGNYSMGEKMLLVSANAQDSDHGIREQLRADEKSMQASDQSFTDAILYGKPVDNGHPVDADAQDNKTGAPVKPAKSDDSATIDKQKSDGWFDWF